MAAAADGLRILALGLLAAGVACVSVSYGSRVSCAGEVIGAEGRIGSFLLQAGSGSLLPAVRGRPGKASKPGSPIFCAAPASALPELLSALPSTRLRDLVLVCNGMAREIAAKQIGSESAQLLSVAVLYFGVASPGAKPVVGPGAPPSFVAGPHAQAFANLLSRAALPCTILPSAAAVDQAAGVKLLWASAMWLICHRHHGCSVDQVHKLHEVELVELVTELFSELNGRAEDVFETCTNERKAVSPGVRHKALMDDEGLGNLAADVSEALAVVRSYSMSMPSVVPSIDLAKREIAQRNGWFLKRAVARGAAHHQAQAFHRKFLLEVLGEEGAIDLLRQCGWP